MAVESEMSKPEIHLLAASGGGAAGGHSAEDRSDFEADTEGLQRRAIEATQRAAEGPDEWPDCRPSSEGGWRRVGTRRNCE